jgi:hypothetical protein
MKDCWAKDPHDRPGFDVIQKRLRDPFGNYDVPKSTANSQDELDKQDKQGEQDGQVDGGSQSKSSTL